MANNDRDKVFTMSDLIKGVGQFLIAAMLAVLGWMATEVAETEKAVVALQGSINLTNSEIKHLREDLKNLPKEKDLAVIRSELTALKSRVRDLEGSMALWQRTNTNPSEN